MASGDPRNNTPVAGVGETLDDRISELPDSLLIQILSLLPTKDAFTTSILSKRWRLIWTFVDNFSFTRSYRYRENFAPFVDYILARSLSPKIKKFQLDYSYDFQYDSQISQWLSFAVKRKVEHVVLWSTDLIVGACTLPQSFCACSSLITLSLGRFKVDADVVIAWKSLKSIKLGNLYLDNDIIANLLSGCPALETMELYRLVLLKGPCYMDIRSSKLKTLKLQGHLKIGLEFFRRTLVIFAPYLEHLEISGDLYDLKCVLVDMPAVVTAKLTFNIMCIKDILVDHGQAFDPQEDGCHAYHQSFRTLVHNYLLTFLNANELTIGTWFTEVVCMLLFKGISLPEMKCKYLTLELHVKKFNLYGVAGLLLASPHVETLNIDISMDALNTKPRKDSHCHFELTHLAKGDDIDLQSWISSFGFPNLKNVEIVNSSGVCFKDHFKQGFGKLLKLSEFLLKNATVLENFVISKRKKCRICSINCLSTCLSQLAEKLLGCPRSSPNCVIIY